MITLAKYKEVTSRVKRAQLLELADVAEECGMPYDAIVSIYSQVMRRKEIIPIETCVQRWNQGETLLEIASSLRVSPFSLIREVFDSSLRPVPLTSRAVSACIKEPWLLSEVHPRLAAELEQISEVLDHQSQSSSRIRQLVGSEYETRLQLQLRALGVPYVTEERLRTEGVAKTPDIRLLTPIYLEGIDHEINWIDSKAMFGDHKVHAAQIKAQFISYVNMFGPGLVIYWFGYVDIINSPASVERTHLPAERSSGGGGNGVATTIDADGTYADTNSSPEEISEEGKTGMNPRESQMVLTRVSSMASLTSLFGEGHSLTNQQRTISTRGTRGQRQPAYPYPHVASTEFDASNHTSSPSSIAGAPLDAPGHPTHRANLATGVAGSGSGGGGVGTPHDDRETYSELFGLSQNQYWHPQVSVRSSLPSALRLFPSIPSAQTSVRL